MRVLDEIRLAVSFLSKLPLGGGGELKRIPIHFPLVGYLCAGSYIGTRWLFSRLISPEGGVLASICLTFYLFNLFHFDGLLDTIDGFLAHKPPQKRLQIMSRGEVGAFAVFFGFVYLLGFYLGLRRAAAEDLLVASVSGRMSMNFLLMFSKPAKSEGLAFALYPFKNLYIFPAFLYTLPLLWFFPIRFGISIGISISIAFTLSLISRKKIGGITGDVLGACCLLAELTSIWAFVEYLAS